MNLLELQTGDLLDLVSRLTPRQMEVVGLLTQGRTTKETATILSIGMRTVKDHVQRACAKLKLDNRIQLIVIYTMWNMENNNHEEKG